MQPTIYTTVISNVLISNFKSTIINLNKCGLQNWPPFPAVVENVRLLKVVEIQIPLN